MKNLLFIVLGVLLILSLIGIVLFGILGIYKPITDIFAVTLLADTLLLVKISTKSIY